MTCEKILNAKPQDRGKGRRPKLGWEDEVDNDVTGLEKEIIKT
jgi:hypothetical protein